MITGYRELAWAAGFLEGEGSFGTQGRRNGVPAITAVQVQKEPLERLVDYFGGSLKQYHRKPGSKAQDFWKWQITGRNAASVMLTLFPLMSPRRQKQMSKAFRIPAPKPGLKLINGSYVGPRTLSV